MSGSEAAFSLSSSPEPPEEPNSTFSNAQASSSTAPTRTFPTTAFAAVEYPGSVSHPSALLKVITQDDMNECFNAPTKETKMLEMKYGGDDRDGIPVRGLRVASQKLLLKVTKRRRREDQIGKGKGKAIDGGEQGVFTAEIIGPITQTVRFRAMADYHYTPNPNGRVSQLVGVLKDLDYDAILEYTVPPLNEEFSEPVTPPFEEDIDENYEPQFRSLLDLQPLPIFSDRRMPFIYNFKQHNQSVMEEVENPRTGLTKQRMINRGRFNGFALPKIGHSGVTPLKPVKELEKKIPNMDQRILARLRELLQDKPIWSRPALLALFNATDRKVIVEGKAYLPAVAYSFGAGPFWKCLVRYGFDPRQDSSTAIWQRIYFYFNVARGGRNAALESDDEEEDAAAAGSKSKNEWRAAQEKRVAEGERPPLDKNRAHLFDGVLLHSDTADFQLCDIHDEQIRKYIDDPSNLTEVCDPQVGWYKPEAMTLIKSLTRIKYEHLRDTDQPAPMSLCYQVIEDFERAKLGARGAEDTGEDVEME